MASIAVTTGAKTAEMIATTAATIAVIAADHTHAVRRTP
jgi:hypothetical protein